MSHYALCCALISHLYNLSQILQTLVQIVVDFVSGPDDHVPDEYLCPITREPMHDPVIAAGM